MKIFLTSMIAIFMTWSASSLAIPVNTKQIEQVTTTPRNRAWSFGLTGMRNEFFTNNWHHWRGYSLGLGVGYGRYESTWFLSWDLQYILGPYRTLSQQDEPVATTGSSMTVWFGRGSEQRPLRGNLEQFGLLAGFGYFDISTKSNGPDQKLEDPFPRDITTNIYLSNYRMRTVMLAIMPGFFYTSMHPLREQGHSEQLQATRIEGYRISFYMTIPLYIRYVSRFHKHDVLEQNVATNSSKITDKGKLFGYSFQVSLTVLLGT